MIRFFLPVAVTFLVACGQAPSEGPGETQEPAAVVEEATKPPQFQTTWSTTGEDAPPGSPLAPPVAEEKAVDAALKALIAAAPDIAPAERSKLIGALHRASIAYDNATIRRGQGGGSKERIALALREPKAQEAYTRVMAQAYQAPQRLPVASSQP